MPAQKKVRIHRNQRLRTSRGTVAFSDKVMEPIKSKVQRIGGLFVINRGDGDAVMTHLYETVADLPDHFTEKSREILGFVAAQDL